MADIHHNAGNSSVIPVIIIFAPTACGKTARAREIFGASSLCRFKSRGEVVSADSQAVYRGMDIGTAKPDAEERRDIPHHLIDLVTPDVQFGLGEWMAAAEESCDLIWNKKHLFPVMVGGTGFYIRNFILGLPVTPQSRPEIRAQLCERMRCEGSAALYDELNGIDPVSASRINPNDAYRIQRALEVYYSCGQPLSSFPLPTTPRAGYDCCTIILTREKEDLYRRIDERVDAMFDRGLEQEVARLIGDGYTKNSPGMKAIGYSEFFDDGRTRSVREQIKLDSKHYAKKQYTFMRGIPGAVTVDASDTGTIMDTVGAFCDHYIEK